MQEKYEERAVPFKRKKKKGNFPTYILIACIIGGSALLYLYYQRTISETDGLEPQGADVNLHTSAPHGNVAEQQQYQLEPVPVEVPEKSDALPESGLDTASSDAGQEEVSEEIPGGQSSTALTNHSQQRALDAITTFYRHLDQQSYLSEFHLNEPSQIHFSKLIQKLLDNPPLVSGETDDLFSILQNTAHFFRIVGRDNILAMKAIISQERNSVEDILADFYSLSKQPDSLKSEFSIEMKEDSLSDYAGFFLTTMGGRLYLFRRDPVLRMLVSYYSILIIDEANQQGRNRHGIDIRPAVNGLITEMENSGNQLKSKERYLDNLYRIKEN